MGYVTLHIWVLQDRNGNGISGRVMKNPGRVGCPPKNIPKYWGSDNYGN